MQTHIYTYIHVNTQMHVCMHTYVHTHALTNTHISRTGDSANHFRSNRGAPRRVRHQKVRRVRVASRRRVGCRRGREAVQKHRDWSRLFQEALNVFVRQRLLTRSSSVSAAHDCTAVVCWGASVSRRYVCPAEGRVWFFPARYVKLDCSSTSFGYHIWAFYLGDGSCGQDVFLSWTLVHTSV